MTKAKRLKTRNSINGPYEAGTPSLKGTLTFLCCGEMWEVTGTDITHVKCPDCGCMYTFSLKYVSPQLQGHSFPPGTNFTAKEDISVSFLGKTYAIKKNTVLVAGNNLYGVLNVEEGEILVKFAPLDPTVEVLVPVPLSKLEPKTPEKVVEDA